MKAIFIISGEKKTGKTLYLQNLISILADTGLKLKKFYSQHNGTTGSYHIKFSHTEKAAKQIINTIKLYHMNSF